GASRRRGGRANVEEGRALRAARYPDGLPTGQAVATTAGDLPARWVIHTVGPVWTTGEDRSQLLRDCYRNSLRVATELGAASIAYPLISAGAYGWPVEDAIRQALAVLVSAESASVAEARLVLFRPDTLELAERILAEQRRT